MVITLGRQVLIQFALSIIVANHESITLAVVPFNRARVVLIEHLTTVSPARSSHRWPSRTEKSFVSVLEFKRHFKQRVPFVIYADFEALTVPSQSLTIQPKATLWSSKTRLRAHASTLWRSAVTACLNLDSPRA